MRSVHRRAKLLSILRRPFTKAADPQPPIPPLDRIELHQEELDEIQSLRARLLDLIVETERQRKASRFRLVN
ncbi:hypothetical protein [Aeoliella mucimassa]|uniref:Uncharacterized protein n=1 Tax=Aeoliella mucimassa TaxID=2527972 RepID=A0A518AM85_9BACT|nr:hypothetical protein [Aeoliella mucimassa]QDU55832.1 hypothetical protein Pan181_20290 [Aeoliella mucimassa]